MGGMDLAGYKAPRTFSWPWRLRKSNADDDRFVAEVTREAGQQPHPAQQSGNGGEVVDTQPPPGKTMKHGRETSASSGLGRDG